jgi:hypothetical protein
MQHEMQYSGLEIGMFLGGLLMALVPIAISIGLGIWALRQRARSDDSAVRGDPTSQETTT